MRVNINNAGPYKIDEGFTIQENYNETLDSASIRISHLPKENKIDIEPFDLVEIIELNRFFCVDSFNCVEEAIGQSDTTFSYSINLFSLTKKMENYPLPNLSITPRKTGDKKTIYEFLNDLLSLYVSEDETWIFSDNFITKFDNIDCPEMQWSNPTFREVCNDLTMTADCIVVLKYNEGFVIDYIDISQTTDASDKTYNYKVESKSSDDYISDIRMDLQNVMQTNVEGVNNVVTTSEFLTLASNDAIITSENCYLKTQYPILNIKHLWLTIICPDGNSTSDIKCIAIRQDLCNIRAEYNGEVNYSSLVCEEKEYDSKEALYRSNIKNINNISINDGDNIETYYSKYRNFYLHYTRNSNIINGLEQKSKPIFGVETSLIYYLKKICALNNLATGVIADNYGVGQKVADGINARENSYFNTYFQIEYETTYNMVFSASKQEKQRHKRTIIDNQTNAWVDAYSQGFLEYQKANRLGNLQVMYNQRGNSGLFVIGDKKDDNVIYRTEYQYYENHTDVNAYATKYYVLCNYFTGIKSKVRTWVNAREEAFIRHDLKKYYCVLDYKENYEMIIANTNFATRLILSPISFKTTANVKPIKYALVRTEKDTNIYPSNSGKFLLNCITRLVGNSLVITTGFEDNWVVDKHPNIGTRPAGMDYNDTGIIEYNNISGPILDTQNDLLVPPVFTQNAILNPIGGITTNYYRYCDENGEFDTIYIYYYDELDYYGDITSDVRLFIYGLYALPVLSDNPNNDYDLAVILNLHKDNKEKPVVSTQLEFQVEDDSIKYTKRFLERQRLICSKRDNNFLKTRLYDANMNLLSESSGTSDINNGTINSCCAYIEYIGDTTNVKYVEVCENDGTSILLYDITKNENHRLYLNIRRTR